MKTSELGVFWAKEAAKDLHEKARRMRNAYRTPHMTAQTYPIADAYARAAKLFDAVVEQLSKPPEDKP